ncbi:hypothetical protein PAHAL_5G353700 [Panicum hallii]|jgi:hypothetical protein|uniref:MATH domain-containing protein n=1 Tax=Panicum hallii TaxID=206008 RepID=A0A2T8IM95_9POAL|nr:BTB/POZ and MATH domain-containing protein 2-like [Panicum hallii]PVH38788.1 hypothetical protein PAHAL_5G353700 [Panicum hallii]
MAKVPKADEIRCMNLTAAASCVFHFKVEGYSFTREAAKSAFLHCYKSDKFSVGGYDWQVRYHPDGEASGCFDLVLQLLCLAEEDVAVRFACTVLCKSGDPLKEMEVAATGNILGFCDETVFAPRELRVSMGHGEAAEFVMVDCLALHYTISVLKKPF